MSENIIVPALGESITEATVSKWIKNQGEQVKEDEPIVELETDKVNVEVPSPAEGVISKINFKKPNVIIGKFDEIYLKIPQEILIITMQQHQKYFPLFDSNSISFFKGIVCFKHCTRNSECHIIRRDIVIYN